MAIDDRWRIEPGFSSDKIRLAAANEAKGRNREHSIDGGVDRVQGIRRPGSLCGQRWSYRDDSPACDGGTQVWDACQFHFPGPFGNASHTCAIRGPRMGWANDREDHARHA